MKELLLDRNRRFLFWSLFALLISCGEGNRPEKNRQVQVSKNIQVQSLENEAESTVPTHDEKIPEDLVDIRELCPSIRVDLKYASDDNFMKQRLYYHTKKLLLQKDVANRLCEVQTKLQQINAEYSLLVYDGARPLSVQQKMWDALDTIPVNQRVKFVSNPANGSIHNYGAAVDLTICQSDGTILDMGAGYDDIREIAYPKFEAYYLEKGELTIEQVNNRKLLRKVMKVGGFVNIPTEWWHFNACSREEAKKKYRLMK